MACESYFPLSLTHSRYILNPLLLTKICSRLKILVVHLLREMSNFCFVSTVSHLQSMSREWYLIYRRRSSHFPCTCCSCMYSMKVAHITLVFRIRFIIFMVVPVGGLQVGEMVALNHWHWMMVFKSTNGGKGKTENSPWEPLHLMFVCLYNISCGLLKLQPGFSSTRYSSKLEESFTTTPSTS